jgi:hypothetical protein
MAVSDTVKSKGSVRIELMCEDGRYFDQTVPNIVVDTGLAWQAARMVGQPAAMSHMAVGSYTGAAQAGDQIIGAELGRVALTSITPTGPTVKYVADFGPGAATGTVAEAGIFNAVSGGTMLNRVVFAAQQKGSGDSMRITWNVTQSA